MVAELAAAKSGKLNVWLPIVRSEDEIVAVKAAALVLFGFKAIESELAVVDEKSAEFVVVKVAAKAPELWV